MHIGERILGDKLNLAILASGNGSNAENIILHAQKYPNLNISVLISDKETAAVIKRGSDLGVATKVCCVKRNEFKSLTEARISQEKEIIKILKDQKVEWILLAGYMRLLSSDFLNQFYDKENDLTRVLNIHPSLLPSFPGKNAYRDAFDYGVKISGATIHFVDSGIDSGPIILQKSFPLNKGDSFEEFNLRGLEVEYELYRELIDILSSGHPTDALMGRN